MYFTTGQKCTLLQAINVLYYYLGVGSGHADHLPVQLALVDHCQGAQGLDLCQEFS